ncbi:MAG: hypothetical protein H0U71_08280 [Gammaproteobacteria bacterium]|nr:hypothetical protein [Gammaproteobacteria bacterium]
MVTQIVIFFSILLIFLIWRFNRDRIRYWAALLQERGWSSTVHYDRCLTVFNKVYENVNPTEISLKERHAAGMMGDTTYTYGEVVFFSFVRILERAHPQPGEVFYDLGSGAGKAVMIAELVFDFSKTCGIEKLAGLYKLSEALKNKLENLPEYQNLLSHKPLNIQFINNDFLTQDISDGDVVFINATCFRGEFFTAIIVQLLKLKVGARVILGSANLDEVGGFKPLYSNLHLMSWGLNSVNIYERI